nr:hypothetical protein [Mesorhizobium loti]
MGLFFSVLGRRKRGGFSVEIAPGTGFANVDEQLLDHEHIACKVEEDTASSFVGARARWPPSIDSALEMAIDNQPYAFMLGKARAIFATSRAPVPDLPKISSYSSSIYTAVSNIKIK